MQDNNKLYQMCATIKRYWKGEKANPKITCYMVTARDNDGKFINVTIRKDYVRSIRKDNDGRVLVTLSFAEFQSTKSKTNQNAVNEENNTAAPQAYDDDPDDFPF